MSTEIDPHPQPEAPPEQPPSGPENAPAPSTQWVMPTLSRMEWCLLVLIAMGGVTVGGIGLYSSFDNVSTYMASMGFEHPELVPLSVDIAIPVFGIAYLLLVRMGMEMAWVRWIPYLLTATTIYLNVVATDQLAAQVAHGVLPSLWVALTEVAAHAYRVRIGRANGIHHDPIPFKRWVLAFPSTLRLWRMMHLWEITSYRKALQIERSRVRAVTAMRTRYGRSWRRKAPLDLRTELRLGELTADQVPSGDDAPELPALDISRDDEEGQPTPEPHSSPWDDESTSARQLPAVETREERELREDQEAEERQRRADGYRRTVELVTLALREGRPISGPEIAKEHTVGARTVQRHFRVMRQEGLLPPEEEGADTTPLAPAQSG